jgi:hypothetical protein
MTTPAPDSEPTLSDVLTAIAGLGRRLDALTETVGDGFARMHAEMVETRREVGRLREDLVGVKVDVAAADRHIGDFMVWARRHESDAGAHGQAA